MYKIEFNSDTTLESLLESFKNLKECGINGYVEIDGIIINGDDLKLKERLTEVLQSKIKEAETEKIDQSTLSSNECNVTFQDFNLSWNLSDLSQNEVFKYFLGVALKYIKPEYREELKKYYIDVYSNDKYKSLRDLHLLANILLLLEYRDIFIVQEKLNFLLLNLPEHDIKRLSFVLTMIEKYAINGELINQCFYRNILDNDIKNALQNNSI